MGDRPIASSPHTHTAQHKEADTHSPLKRDSNTRSQSSRDSRPYAQNKGYVQYLHIHIQVVHSDYSKDTGVMLITQLG